MHSLGYQKCQRAEQAKRAGSLRLELASAGTMGLLFLSWLGWQSLSRSLSRLGFGLKLLFQD